MKNKKRYSKADSKKDLEERKLIELLRRRNKDLRVENKRFLISFINKSESDLRNSLTTLSTFLLIFTSPIITDLQTLNPYEKEHLFKGWVFLFISILLGLIQFFVDINFFDNAIEREDKAEKVWRNAFPNFNQYEERSRLESAIFQDTPLRTPIIFIAFQIISLLAGFILMGIVVRSIIFAV